MLEKKKKKMESFSLHSARLGKIPDAKLEKEQKEQANK